MENRQIENTPETGFLALYAKAEAGDALAQYQLGLCFLNGMGVGRNTFLAKFWLSKSASLGFATAARELQWVEESALLDTEGILQWLKDQALQQEAAKAQSAPVQEAVPEPVTAPEPAPVPAFKPLPAHLLVPEYTPLPRKTFVPRPTTPGASPCGTQYLIEGHPTPPAGQPIGYVPQAPAYSEPIPPYVPQPETDQVAGVSMTTSYLLEPRNQGIGFEDTVINREKPGILDRLIIGFNNARFHKVCTVLGAIVVFVMVVGIGHCIGRFDRLISAGSELRDVSKLVHIHATKSRPVDVSKSSISSMVEDLMDSSYGRFDAKLGCWASRSGGTEFCFKVNRVDAVKTWEGTRIYVLATGRMASDSNIADGIIGMFVLEPQFASNYTTVAKNPFVTAGSGDEPPESWHFVKLGRDDVWGWQGEIENNSLGETDSGIILFMPDEGSIKNVGYIPTSFEMLDLRNVNGHIANARQSIDLKGTVKIEETGSGMYPIRLTVSGIRNGSQKQGESILINFKKDLGEYVIPMRNPYTY